MCSKKPKITYQEAAAPAAAPVAAPTDMTYTRFARHLK